MADLQSTIDLIFRGIDQASDVADKIGGNIAGALGKISQAGDALEGIAAPLATVSDKILETEAAITVLGSTLIGVGVKSAGEFNDAFAFTSTLFDATSPQLKRFSSDILVYASDSTQSIDKINSALQNAIGQGVAYSDSLALLADSEKLAVAQGAALDDATSLLAGTLNSYGLKISDAARLSDVFSITVRDGKISVAELASQLSKVLPIAVSAGIGVEQIGAAVAVLTANNFSAEQAITGVKNIIEGLIKPTGQASDYAQSLGLSFDATTLKSRGLYGILQDVQKATGGNVDAFAKLFTTSEGLTAALALSGVGAGKFAQELKAMREETGVTDAAFQKMANNVDLGAQRIENAIKVAFIGLGTPLLDELGTIQKGIATVFAEIGKEFEDGGALRPITAALEAWGADIGATIAAIAANLPAAFESVDVSGLIDAYQKLGEEVAGLFRSFFGDIDLSTVEGLSAAMQRVIDTIETLTRTSAGIVDAFKPMAAAAGETVDSFVRLDEASKVDFGEFLGAMRSIVLAGPEIASALILIGRSGVEMGTVINAVFGGVQVAVNALQVTFDAVVLGVLSIQKALLESGLAIAEFSAKFALTDAATQQSNEAIANFKGRLMELEPVMDGVAANLARNKDELENGWKRAAGEAATETEKLSSRLDVAQRSIERFGQQAKAGAGETHGMALELQKLQDIKLDKFDIAPSLPGAAAAEAAGQLIRVGEASQQLVPKLVTVRDENGKVIQTYTEMTNVIPGVTGTLSVLGKGLDESGKKAEEAKDKSEQFLIKMEEIASNERIKTIEATVSLKTEQLKADVERVKATFASIDTTIKSTGDLLGSLFGNLTSTDDPFKASKIESQIDLENKRRDEALQIQKKLAEAEIERINAQTRALDRGDALIKVEAAGLEPHLEAIWFQIMKFIRVRVNADAADYLLGAA